MADELRTCQEVKVKYEDVIDEVMEFTTRYDPDSFDDTDLFDHVNVRCPFCRLKMIISGYVEKDDEYKFGFMCPSCHYVHKKNAFFGYFHKNNVPELLKVFEEIDSASKVESNSSEETNVEKPPKQKVEDKYYSLIKAVRLFDARKSQMFSNDSISVKCPYCGCGMEETYYYHRGYFRLKLECQNGNCGFGCNSWNAEDLIENLTKFVEISKNEIFFTPDYRPEFSSVENFSES